MTSLQKSYCRKRWDFPVVNFERLEIKTCCKTEGQKVSFDEIEEYKEDLFLNTPYQKARRAEMLKGVRHSSCETCWAAEDSGLNSFRQNDTKLAKPWIIKDKTNEIDSSFSIKTELVSTKNSETVIIRDIDKDHSILRSDKVDQLEIVLGNECNLKCSYCSPFYSTKWREDLELWALGTNSSELSEASKADLFEKLTKRESEAFWNYFWSWFDNTVIKSVDRISLIGGEPLISSMLPRFLKRLEESLVKRSQNSQEKLPKFIIVTNLSLVGKKFQELLTKIKAISRITEVEIQVSFENIGEKAEYVRNGLNWSNLNDNLIELCKLKDSPVSIGVQMAINSLSVSSLQKVVSYIYDLSVEYDKEIILYPIVVTYPEVHKPFILPSVFSKHIAMAILKIDHILNSIGNNKNKMKNSLYYLKSVLTPMYHSLRDSQSETAKWDAGSIDLARVNFYRYFSAYDKVRGTSFDSVFPEYGNFFDHCKDLHKSSSYINPLYNKIIAK